MNTMRITANVPNDRELTLRLSAEVPPGPVELVVTVESQNSDREPERAEARCVLGVGTVVVIVECSLPYSRLDA